MPSLSFIGTGSGFPSAERFFSSTLVHLGSIHLLVDAGEPCVHLLRDRGNMIGEIDAILITHGHVDHIGGIPAFLQGAMLIERKKPLAIHLPREMISPLKAWIAALYLTEIGLGFSVSWNPWNPDAPALLEGDVSITSHANKHLVDCYRVLPGADPSKECQSYSLDIKAGNFRTLFSGDLASASELLSLVVNPATVLVSELSHVTIEELVSVLAEADLGTLCLVHLSEDMVGDRSELQGRMEELLPAIKDVIVPEDGTIIDF